MNFLILTGGALSKEFLELHIQNHKYDKLICADGGLFMADQLGLSADFIVGDFDSLSKETIRKYKTAIKEKKISSKWIAYNPVKDMTDTQIALELAIEQGASQITILGGTGTRVDHVIGNINLLMKPLKENIPAKIIDPFNQISLLNQKTIIQKEEQYGNYVSLLPLTQRVTGVTLTGMKYPLKDAVMTIGESLGVSNEILDEKAEISCKSGILILIESKD